MNHWHLMLRVGFVAVEATFRGKSLWLKRHSNSHNIETSHLGSLRQVPVFAGVLFAVHVHLLPVSTSEVVVMMTQ